MWNRQRKDEVLIDVRDVALGHIARMRWNDEDKWIFSEEIAHPPIIDAETFRRAQVLLMARKGARGGHKPHKSRHAYALSGLLFCGICDRRMQGHWANAAPYYRCRFPNEYALANHVQHPLNVTLRQDIVLDPLDTWLASKFDPHHLPVTIDELAAAILPPATDAGAAEIDAQIDGCDRKLAQYRAALDAGADPATVARWITETETERAKYQAIKRAAAPQLAPARMSRDQIASVVAALSDALTVLSSADPADKAQIYAGLGLRLTYQPSERLVRTEVRIRPAQHWQFESVRGGT